MRHTYRFAAVLTLTLSLVVSTVAGSRPSSLLGNPLPGLTDPELALFDTGKDEFQDVETVENGLGPVFTRPPALAATPIQWWGAGANGWRPASEG